MISHIIKRLVENKELLREFVVRDLKMRYVGSMVGFFWSVINPLLTLLIYTFLFSVILKVKLSGEAGVTNFALYLFCGMLPWIAFQDTVNRSTTCVVDHEKLIKKLVFPAKILPLYIAISSLISEFIGVVILLLAIIFIMHFISPFILLLPIIVFFQVLFSLGFSFAFAALNVPVRDISPISGVLLTVWMYLTPIFYPQTIVPERYIDIYMLNPMAHLVIMYRDIFLNNKMFSIFSLFYFSLVSVLFFLAGYFIFTKFHKKFVDFL